MVFVRLFVIALLCMGSALYASDATESIRSAIDELKKKMETESTQTVVESTMCDGTSKWRKTRRDGTPPTPSCVMGVGVAPLMTIV